MQAMVDKCAAHSSNCEHTAGRNAEASFQAGLLSDFNSMYGITVFYIDISFLFVHSYPPIELFFLFIANDLAGFGNSAELLVAGAVKDFSDLLLVFHSISSL